MLDLRTELAAAALSRGDPLQALSQTNGRSDPHALAIRGIALAQLKEYPAARRSLQRAAAEFERIGAVLYRARAAAALAEIAAGERDLHPALTALARAANELEALGDHGNAAWCRLVEGRLHLLRGAPRDAARALERAGRSSAATRSPLVRAVGALAEAERRLRGFETHAAEQALERAAAIATEMNHPLLLGEVERQRAALARPIARVRLEGATRPADPFELERLFASKERSVVIDALRRRVLLDGAEAIDLVRKPVLFALFAALAERSPEPAAAGELIPELFLARRINDSHRARLRVELGRLRRLLGETGRIETDRRGWRFEPAPRHRLVLVLPIDPSSDSALAALLGDGAAWSTPALASILKRSPRSVQRALAPLIERGEVQAFGRGRAVRYVLAVRAERIASQMLLLGLVEPR